MYLARSLLARARAWRTTICSVRSVSFGPCTCNTRLKCKNTRGSFLTRRQRGHPGVVFPLVISKSANHYEGMRLESSPIGNESFVIPFPCQTMGPTPHNHLYTFDLAAHIPMLRSPEIATHADAPMHSTLACLRMDTAVYAHGRTPAAKLPPTQTLRWFVIVSGIVSIMRTYIYIYIT